MPRLVSRSSRFARLVLSSSLIAAFATAALADKPPLTFADLMKLRTVDAPQLSRNGEWLVYVATPDRGDPTLVARAVEGDTTHRVPLAVAPRIARGGDWVAARLAPSLEAAERARKAGKKGDDGPKAGLVLLSTADGGLVEEERVKAFAFSADGRWLAYHREKEPDEDRSSEEGEAGEGSVEEAPVEPGTEAAPAVAASPEGAPAEEASTEEASSQPESPAEAGSGGAEAESEASSGKKDEKKKDERVGTTLVLRELASGTETDVPHVDTFAFAEVGATLAYTVAEPGGAGNRLVVHPLGEENDAQSVSAAPRGRYTALTWTHETLASPRLAFVAAVDDEDGEPGDGAVWTWPASREVVSGALVPEGWHVPSTNELAFSRDGERLFLGLRPREPDAGQEGDAGADGHDPTEEGVAGESEAGDGEAGTEEEEPFDPYDFDAILEDRTVDVWHWDDPLINPNQKEAWDDEEKRTYPAVLHLAAERLVPLADREMREVEPADNPRGALGIADVPYLKERTWDGFYVDLYHVDLRDGGRTRIGERLADPDASLSPGGRFVAFYDEPHWYLFDADDGTTRNLTASLDVPFADEDHDYPMPASGYGVGGWVEGDAAVLIYDKFDLWRFPTGGGAPECVTGARGRETRTVYRLIDLDPDEEEIGAGGRLLLTAYDDRRKSRGIAEARADGSSVRALIDEPRTYRVLAKAEDADRLLLTRERYDEFPDLWTADLELGDRRRLSDVNPEVGDFAWGRAELVQWRSADGVPHDGVLIKPGNYREGERYPVVVYYYRFFSQRLHLFNQPVVNHRPSFPVYASHGYAVFLPDIRFEVGRPGLSAVQSLVPGVNKLIEMGIADPDRIGLHGHSWSGYQTAFAITQTDIFAAAVAGAPVSNMTSAYSGIRWGSGLARQFQYEKSQSRLGVSLWEGRDRYIDNSPVFFADRINTPLLIQFGDEDGAVPWYQGIELYLAMRRLGKEAVFLQYRGEDHHLKKYANKLDYSIKMKAFFDHYLKDEAAPDWLADGVPYSGE